MTEGDAMRRAWLAAVVLIVGLSAGCGGGRDRGKNLDHDRPKATR